MAEYDAVKKQWGSFTIQPANHNSNDNYLLRTVQLIFDMFSKHKDKVAQINDDTGVQLTFNEFRLQSTRAAQNLLKMGFEPRQTLGFMANNCDELASVVIAAIWLACPIMPLVEQLSNPEILTILKKAKPSAIFCDVVTYQNRIKPILMELELELKIKVFTFGGQIDDDTEPVSNLLLKTGDEDNFVPVQIDIKKDIAGIFFSSGTTGPSKGIILSYGLHGFTAQLMHDLTLNTVTIDVVNSIYWATNIKTILDAILSGITRIITAKPLTNQHQLKLIEKYKINVLRMSPSNLIACLKYERINELDLSSVNHICMNGAKLPLHFIPDIKRHFPNASIVEYFGLTEIGSISTVSLDSPNDVNFGGHRLVANNIVKIVDDDGNRCGPNEAGEIRVIKPFKFAGYLNDPIQTANAIDDEGFFRTGDIGHFNDQGFLFITDRLKNIMISFYYGIEILPREIEECLIKLSDIKEACVVGIPITTQYLPAVAIVRMPGSKLSQRDIFNVIAENFPDRAKPRGGIYFFDHLPRTHSAKLIRREIAKSVTEKFRLARENDAELRSYLTDMPEEFRNIVYKCDLKL